MSDTLDQKNTKTVVFGVVAAGVILAGVTLGIEAVRAPIDVEVQKTEQVRLEGCTSIEDEGVRALCLNSSAL